jgi:hypothetical protein
MKDGLRECSRDCIKRKKQCSRGDCKFWISYPEEYNCCLVSIYENGPMTLRQVGDRIGLSFARIKQIETIALKKMKKNTLLTE